MNGPVLNPLLEWILILLLVLLSAAHTAAESAVQTLMLRDRRRRVEADNDPLRPAPEPEPIPLGRLTEQPHALTATFLLGRMIARILAVAFTAHLALDWVSHADFADPLLVLLVGTLLTVLLLLALTEVLPRILGLHAPEAVLAWTAPVVRIFGVLFIPLTAPMAALLRRAARRALGESAFLTTDELHDLLEERIDEGTLEAEDREMIEDLLEFGKTMVREVMVPRIDIKAVGVHEDCERVRVLVRETGHSRLPLFDGDLDHIIGIIHAKDLLRQEPEAPKKTLKELAREAHFVPETKMIDDLLREFQQTRSHMAIVVDEYGGTAGLATLEDLLEEIVGEIQDEYDSETPLVEALEGGGWLVEALISLEEFEETTGIKLPQDDIDTLGGFLYSLEGKVPRKGQVLTWQDLDFTIREKKDRRILKVEVRRRPPELPLSETD
jgi:putative hemolysin